MPSNGQYLHLREKVRVLILSDQSQSTETPCLVSHSHLMDCHEDIDVTWIRSG